jgi:hypothetical protein
MSEPSISKLAQLAGERLIGSPTLCGIINQPMMVASAGGAQPIAQVRACRFAFASSGPGRP